MGRTVGGMANRSRTYWALLCVAALGLMSSCGPGPLNGSPEEGSVSTNIDGQFSVESTPATPDRLVIHDLVQAGEALVALASTKGRPAGTVLRSEDGGLSWTEIQTPLPDAIEGFEHDHVGPGTVLMVAGSWLVAVRATSATSPMDDPQFMGQQAVAVSADFGLTWQLVELAAPAGSEPLVWTAIEVDGRLVLGGGTQVLTDLPVYPEESDDILGQAYDSALWASSDLALGFERLAASQFDGLPDAQMITELVIFDGRLIAIEGASGVLSEQCCYRYGSRVTVAWESADGGGTWSPMDGLSVPDGFQIIPAFVTEEGLILRLNGDERFILAPGASAWRSEPQFADLAGYGAEQIGLGAGYAEEIALGDGLIALTFNATGGCDCSVAYGGRVGDGRLTISELSFRDCQDESRRGETEVYGPGLIGDRVAAMSSCDDRGTQVASLAYSGDNGMSWDTVRLAEFAPDGSDLAVEDYVFLLEDGVLVALLSVLGTATEDGSQIMALRISATD